MQQYRVNFPLLIWLLVGAVVCSGAVYGVWKFQIERKSGWLIREADAAAESGNLHQAAQYYSQYLTIHSEDNVTRFKYANTLMDMTQQDNVTPEDVGSAVRGLETILRNRDRGNDPEAKKLRRRLVELYSKGNFGAALDHLNILLENDPNDAELQTQRVTFLARSGNVNEAIKQAYKLIGYDDRADAFDAKKATAPNQTDAYSTAATLVRGNLKKPEVAERILDQMVEVNPTSAKALVQRGILRGLWGNEEGARADAEKAYQLKPDEIDVLMLSAEMAMKDEQLEKAHTFVDQAKKLHPDDARVYQAAANLDIKEKHYDKALAQIEEGVKKIAGFKGIGLVLFKAGLQLQQQDVKGARQTVDDLRKVRNLRPELIDDVEARILLVEGKWIEASEMFSRLRGSAADFGRDRVVDIDYNLGLCYERMGRPDQARNQYQLVLQQDPENAPAMAGVERMSLQLGVPSTSNAADEWSKAVDEELKKPKDQQDLAKLNNMLQGMAKERGWEPVIVKLTEVQLAMMREDFETAGKLIGEAKQLAPNNLQVMRTAVAWARLNPKMGPDAALEGLNKVVTQFGDLPSLRLDKVAILIQKNKDLQDKGPLKQELAGLATGIDQWTTAQKVELWRGLASNYLSLNMVDEARQYLALAADAQPNELPLRLALFSLALDAGDDAAMQEAQDKILQVVKDKNDSAWLYAEARRRLLLVRRSRSGPEDLAEIRKLANQALKQRPDWSDLYVLLAEVELLSNNVAQALQNYDKAEDLGRPSPSAVAQHIRLLSVNGRFADAGKLLDRIPESIRQTLLGPLYGEILFRSNQTEAALKQVRAAVEADPKSAPNQYALAQLVARSAQDPKLPPQRRNEMMAEAIQAMQRATELQPDNPDSWFALINYFAMQKDEVRAQQTMRDAQLALSGDSLTFFLARSYEVLHRPFDAETMYREIYETAPDEIGRAQQLAAFYVGPLYQRPDKQVKATPLLNQILRAGAEKKIPANDGNLLWARRTAAKMLALTNEYQNLVKAEKLLASNSQDGNLLIDDKLAMAEILAQRPEPVSRMKAIALLEEVARLQPLNDVAEIQLGELYLAVGNPWTRYRSQMEKAIATYPNSVKARETYARRLIAQGEQRSLDEAARQVERMNQIAPGYSATFELAVRLAGKLGKQQQVRAQLLSRLPKIPDGKDLDPALVRELAMYASLLTDLGDLDSAEKIYQDLAARNPNTAFDLAKFLGQHRDPELCFAKLAEVYTPANVADVLSVALLVARERRDKLGDKHDAEIQRWLDAALRENPDSISLMIVQADLFDLQKKYDEAAAIYRKLLARNEMTGLRRAIVLNNLAFLDALAGSAAAKDDDPLALVQEAVQIMGPNAEILDTRAVVLIAQGKYKEAIRDLSLAVTDNPTASKYFHKANAHYLAKETRNAVEAWEKAESLGLNRDALNRMEFELYDDLKAKIDQLRKPAVTQAEPARKAG